MKIIHRNLVIEYRTDEAPGPSGLLKADITPQVIIKISPSITQRSVVVRHDLKIFVEYTIDGVRSPDPPATEIPHDTVLESSRPKFIRLKLRGIPPGAECAYVVICRDRTKQSPSHADTKRILFNKINLFHVADTFHALGPYDEEEESIIRQINAAGSIRELASKFEGGADTTDAQKTKPKWVPKNVSDDEDESLSQILDDPVMQDVSSETPVFLIPCQIETRLFPDTLKIRIYPDQIAIDSLQRKLTKDEMQHGKEFCLDDDPQAAWRHLTKSYNPGRSAWIVKEATEHKSKIGGPDDIYSYRNPEDLRFPTLKLLPAFFVVSLHLDNGEVIRVVGNEITSSSLKIIDITENSTFSNEAAWVANFEEANDKGMAVTVDRKLLKDVHIIRKITVVGIRPQDHGDKNGKELLNEIFESHHYSKGINFIKHGTPTNNTEEAVAGFTKNEDIEARLDREFNEEPCISQNVVDLSRALCLDPTLLCKWENGNRLSSSHVEEFHKAMWPSTGGYYLSRFFEENISKKSQYYLKKHFIKFVRPLGYLPSIRIGKIPYGILPVTRIRQDPDKIPRGWRASSLDSVTIPANMRDAFLFDMAFQEILEKLAIRWLEAAASDQFPNVTSGTADFSMDEQISRILAMSPDSLDYVVRRFNDHDFANLLLKLGMSSIGEYSPSDLETARFDHILKLQNFIDELAGENMQFHSLLAYIETFGNLRSNPYPLIRDSQQPEDGDGPENYLPNLPSGQATINDSNTLLYKLLFRSKMLGTNGDYEVPYLLQFDDLELESLLKSVLDLFSFRLDAWISSLANKRLLSMRDGQGGQKDEILIGAYGYVENLTLIDEEPQNSGFIHAPSPDQATTAAILKNAFDSYTEYEENPCRINVSSDRIRRALTIMQGLREDQELGALLGYQFERMLHDRNKDQYIDEFRNIFPFTNQNNNEEAASEAEPDDEIYPRIVVNGLKIIEDFDYFVTRLSSYSTYIPQNIVDAFTDTDVQDAVFYLKDTMDAVNDLMTHEAVYQTVRANYERAGAALDIASGAAFPVEPESVSIALPHTNVEHRICLTFDTENIEISINASPREKAEPLIAQWFTNLLGNIKEIGCTVQFKTIDSEGDAVISDAAITIDDLNLKPIDFLYLCSNRPGGGATELESRIKQIVRENNNDLIETFTSFKLSEQSLENLGRAGISDSVLENLDHLKNKVFAFENEFLGAVESEIGNDQFERYKNRILQHSENEMLQIEIDFKNHPTTAMANAIELGSQVLNFLAQASFLKPGQLYKQLEPPEDEDESETISPVFTSEDYQEIKCRVQESFDDFGSLCTTLERLITPIQIGMKYTEACMSLLSEITQLLQTNEEVAIVPENVLQGLQEYLASHFDASEGILDSSTRGLITDIITNTTPPEGYNTTAEILNVVESLLLSRFIAEPLLPSLPEIPTDLKQAIESVNNLIFANFFPFIESIRSYGLSFEFHQQLTPPIVLSIYDSARKRAEQATTSWSSLPPDVETDGAGFDNLIERVISTAKFIFGESFVILPQFDTPERDRLNDAIKCQAEILNSKKRNRIYQWMQEAAQTHAPVQRLEDFLLITDAWTTYENKSRFTPNIITLPIVPGKSLENWQALCNDESGYKNNSERPRGILNLALFSNHFEFSDKICGLHIDSWEEDLPFDQVDTAVSFQADTPNQQPIHCCLIAVPGDRSDKIGFWNLLDLEAIVCDTIDLAKIRGVDLDAMPDVAGLFPAIFMPADPEQDNALNWEKVGDIVRFASQINLQGET